MPFKDVEFQTVDRVTLRGWFYTPQSFSGKLPCLVMAPGFGALKKMGFQAFPEYFTSKLQLACLLYDNRGFGDSDVKEGEPLREIMPHFQISDYSDAITFAQTLPEVDPDKIGVWGSSYTGAHVLCVGAIDRRVKIVLSQVYVSAESLSTIGELKDTVHCSSPLVSGWDNFIRTYRPAAIAALNKAFQEDRLARAEGKEPRRIPLVEENNELVALPTEDSLAAYTSCFPLGLINDVTLKSIEALRAYEPQAYIHRISPTPLMMSVMDNDVITPQDLALEAFARAREPKRLEILKGGHFDPYAGEPFEKIITGQIEFLKTHFL